MKKIKKLIILIIWIIMIIPISSSAKEIFVYDWETKTETSTVSYYYNNYINYEFSYLLYTNYQNYLDGYITTEEIYDITSDSWKTLVTYYDDNGNIIKQNSDYNFTIDDMLVVNNTIYVVAYDSKATSNQYTIKILNEDLKEEKSSILQNYVKNWDVYTRKYYGIDFISTDEDNLIIYSGYYVYVIDLDLNNDKYNAATSYNILTLEYTRYNVLRQLYGNYIGGTTGYVSSNKVGENETLLSGAYYDSECTTALDNGGCKTSYIISSFDDNNNMLWSYYDDAYLGITDATYIGDYIVGLAKKYDDDYNIIDYVVVLDKNGNVIQEIEEENNLMMLQPTEKGFMLVSHEDKNDNDLTNYKIKVYVFNYEIETKTDNNGIITVSNNAKEGEKVTFTITPNDGYGLSTLKITDSNGNTITYTEGYTFTMPASDVTIEATFVKNPETQDIAISIITILAILAIIVVIDNRNKLKWLNK